MAEVTPTNSLIPGGNQSTIDSASVSIIQRNSLALGSVSAQIANISMQMGAMSQSLAQVQQTIAQNTFLEQQREANEQKRQDILAQEALRQGQESVAEKKIQNALMTPVRTVTAAATGIFQRLQNTLAFLVVGWLGNKFIEWMRAKANGNTGLMRQIKDVVLKSALTIGGVLAIATIGIGSIITAIAGIGIKIGSFVIKGLVVRPLAALLKFFGKLATQAWRGLIGAGGRVLPKAGALTGMSRIASKSSNPLIKGVGYASTAALGWWMGSQGNQSGVTQDQQGNLSQTVKKDNQWWDFLNVIPDGQENVQIDQQRMEEAARIVRTPELFNHEQVTAAREFLANPAGGGAVQPNVQPTEQAVPGQEKERGWWSKTLGVVDAVTGGATDFDNMGSEGQIFNPISGGADGKWGPEAVGPLKELPPTVIELPAVNMSGIIPSGGGNPNGPVNATPNISSKDESNIYAMSAQSNFNVVAA